ncbi:MAG: hypothetical protein HC897_00895 [Thermoanaerobaculia bacterium]|nr:hypothetical protein [Thermoanaerobaculia bacterium]
MTTTERLHRAQQRLTTLTSERLRVANDFLAYLGERERGEAAEELLALPGFLDRIRETEEDVRLGRLTPIGGSGARAEMYQVGLARPAQGVARRW